MVSRVCRLDSVGMVCRGQARVKQCCVRGKFVSAVLIIKNPPGKDDDDDLLDMFSQGLSLMFHISPSQQE